MSAEETRGIEQTRDARHAETITPDPDLRRYLTGTGFSQWPTDGYTVWHYDSPSATAFVTRHGEYGISAKGPGGLARRIDHGTFDRVEDPAEFRALMPIRGTGPTLRDMLVGRMVELGEPDPDTVRATLLDRLATGDELAKSLYTHLAEDGYHIESDGPDSYHLGFGIGRIVGELLPVEEQQSCLDNIDSGIRDGLQATNPEAQTATPMTPERRTELDALIQRNQQEP